MKQAFQAVAALAAVVFGLGGCGGPAGPTGPVGPAGTDGLGVLAVLSVHTTFAGAAGTTVACPSTTYTAGAGQTAILSAQIDCMGVPAGGFIAVKPVAQQGAGADTPLGYFIVNTNTGSTAAELGASSTVATPLTAGAVYTFKLQALGTTAGQACYCDLTAEVVGS
jgi:hypothetical protein